MPGYETNEHLYTEGCYDKLVGHLASHSLILGGIGACVPLLLVSLHDVSLTSLPLCLICFIVSVFVWNIWRHA